MEMRIVDLLREREVSLSFEVFPPKKTEDCGLNTIFETIRSLLHLKPDFFSVTYGAGGGSHAGAMDISGCIQQEMQAISLAHLTAVGYLEKDIAQILDKFYELGVRNLLGLRGDIPTGVTFPHGPWKDFHYAKDLIAYLKADGRFCIGAAAYPEGYLGSGNLEETIQFMQEKVEAGADFFITQLFFDNRHFYTFMEKVQQAKITTPVIAGIMPVMQARQIKRIVELSGASIPHTLEILLDRYEDNPQEMQKAGIDFAVAQIEDLMHNSVKGIHLYTMNRSSQAYEIVRGVGLDKRRQS